MRVILYGLSKYILCFSASTFCVFSVGLAVTKFSHWLIESAKNSDISGNTAKDDVDKFG